MRKNFVRVFQGLLGELHVPAVLVMLLRDDHQPAGKEEYNGILWMNGVQALLRATTIETLLRKGAWLRVSTWLATR